MNENNKAVIIVYNNARWTVTVSEHGYTRSLGPYPSEADANAVADAEINRLKAGPFYESPKR